uniref:Uncharacterized protein n=1 Tax=Timema douglasi TaxID=61478 RepID=A0A7R8VGX4_TIMDO|nr:unnamed protein product [Timema douglasi]
MIYDLSFEAKDLSSDNSLGHSLRQKALLMVLQLCRVVKTIQQIPTCMRIHRFSARMSESC